MASRRRSTSIALLLLGLSFPLALEAQDLPLPREEAPTALFEADLLDAKVDFFIEGSWTARLAAGFGFSWGADVEGVQAAGVEDFSSGLLFEQTPELTLSLWYDDQYFFETQISSEQTLETFLFGYFGEEDDLLQELRIGNTDIGRGELGSLSLPEASRASLGTYGRMKSEYGEHHLALRYDPADTEELHFLGSKLLVEERIAPEDYIRGRFFVLPDEGVEALRVYLEDDQGIYQGLDGRRYRRLDDSEVVVSAAEGLVLLRRPVYGDLVVSYSKNGSPVGDPELGPGALCGLSLSGTELDLEAEPIDFDFGVTDYMGLDLSALEREIEGRQSLLLYSPGRWSPFELRSVYRVSGDGRETAVELVDTNGTQGQRLPLAETKAPEEWRISPVGAGLRDHAARYPLMDADYGFPGAARFYGPEAAASEARGYELLFQHLTPVSGHNLGTNVLDGSIRVERNGIPTSSYSFDPVTGALNFFLPPAEGERIDIFYRISNPRAVGGDLLAVSANTFGSGEPWRTGLDFSLRWNADPMAYTTDEKEAEGAMLGLASVEYSGQRLSARVEAGVEVSNPNTTGRLRLFGMDDSLYPVVPGPENLYPAAPSSASEYQTGEAESLNFLHANRGKLFFKDHYNYSFTGGYSLMHYTWDPPPEQVSPYQDGGRVGPYLAATGSETAGEAMVLEYRLEAGQWVGGRIPLSDGDGQRDLSGARAINLLLKPLGTDGSVPPEDIQVHLLIGRLAEDLDADEELDAERSPYDEGFSFDLAEGGSLSVAPALRWAPQYSRINSEDIDGNEVLDGAGAPLPDPVVVELTDPSIGFAPDQDQWQRLTIPLNEEDRRRLQAATAFDILISYDSGSGAEGRLLVADIDLEGSPFTGSSERGTTVRSYSRPLDPGSIEDQGLMSHSEAALLNGDGGFDSRVLKIEWEEPVDTDTWQVEGFTPARNLGDYGKISFFIKTGGDGGTPPLSMTVSLRNSAGEGLAVSFAPPDTASQWRKLTWDLDAEQDAGRITVDDQKLDALLVSLDQGLTPNRHARRVNSMLISAEFQEAASLEIDEIYFHDPITNLGLGGRTFFSYRYDGPLWSWADRVLIEDLSFEQEVYGQQPTYRGGTKESGGEQLAFSNNLSMTVLGLRLQADYDGRWAEQTFLPAGGYSLELPLLDGGVVLKDNYRESHELADLRASRRSSLQLREERLGSLTLKNDLYWSRQKLKRSWYFETAVSGSENYSLRLTDRFLAQNDQYTQPEEEFFSRLGAVNRLTLPFDTEGRVARQQNHQIAFEFHQPRWSLSFTPAIEAQSFPRENPLQLETRGMWQLNLRTLLSLGSSESASLSLSLAREGSNRETYGAVGSFANDLHGIFLRASKIEGLWLNPPLWDIFHSDTKDDFSQNTLGSRGADLGSTFNLLYQRNPGSHFIHLFSPNKLSLGVERSLERDYDSVLDYLDIHGSYTTTALNLFGRLGRYALFDWYRTEEISHKLTYTSRRPYGGGIEEEHKISLSQYLSLLIDQRRSAGLSSTWERELPDPSSNFSSRLRWESKKMVDWTIPFDKQLEVEQQLLVHREELQLKYTDVFEEGVSEALFFSHTSELQLVDVGYVRIFGRIGYQRRRSMSEIDTYGQHTLAVETGTEIELRF